MKMFEKYAPGTPRYEAVCRALTLAGVDLDTVSIHGILVHRNHIEYWEFQRTRDGSWAANLRKFMLVTKRRIVRNPNPRLAGRR